ncbi:MULTISPECIES: hypothetical protein [Sphingobium]|uniref:hypothetical protein n=1 Tax=Sphingobium TaxID=165695 RepID=UPI0011149AB9|nr:MULTISPECIES: hypothetical protein [Sphingobium]WQE09135.1 hypothetical protein U0025_09910 [Sphingobium yanoikuyae]
MAGDAGEIARFASSSATTIDFRMNTEVRGQACARDDHLSMLKSPTMFQRKSLKSWWARQGLNL